MIKIMQRETYVSDLADEYRRGYDAGRRNERAVHDKLTRNKRKRTEYKGGNGMKKVKLPREVAKAIYDMRAEGMTDYKIMRQVAGARVTPTYLTIQRWAWNGEGTPDLLMRALVNGYKVEKTPEEKVREYYECCREAWLEADEAGHPQRAEHMNGQTLGISTSLEILGIKIDGINA